MPDVDNKKEYKYVRWFKEIRKIPTVKYGSVEIEDGGSCRNDALDMNLINDVDTLKMDIRVRLDVREAEIKAGAKPRPDEMKSERD